jgi:hypothetical protein
VLLAAARFGGATGWLCATGVGRACLAGFTAGCRVPGRGAGALIVMCATFWMGPGSAPV